MLAVEDTPARRQLAAEVGLDPLDPVFHEALRHRSWSTMTRLASNERLELLGDAALGWAVTRLLFGEFPANAEGELAALKGQLVSAEILGDVARTLTVGASLYLGASEEASGGRGKTSLLADAVEACLGAVAWVHGIEEVDVVVTRWMGPYVSQAHQDGLESCLDPKGRLQILSQRAGQGDPTYRFSVSGPDHAPVFVAEVCTGIHIGRGRGRSKKQASAAAAADALELLAEQ